MRSWDWLKKDYLKKEIETAQDQNLCTRNMRNMVYGENVQSNCHGCGVSDESCTYCLRMTKTSTEGIQTSETW